MKWKCQEFRCGWHGDESAILQAPDPFNDGEVIAACPECREVGTLVSGCDEPGCTEIGSCGWPSEAGYRRTCGAHAAFFRPALHPYQEGRSE